MTAKTPGKAMSTRKKRRLKQAANTVTVVHKLIDEINQNGTMVKSILEDTDCLKILNKTKVNCFLNLYLSRIFDSVNSMQQLNNTLMKRIKNKKDIVPPSDYAKVYLRSRELENEQVRLVTELIKCQEVKLDLEEQNMVIIYRSLPPHLKQLMYKTIMEFVRSCPEIQNQMQLQAQKQKEGNQSLLRQSLRNQENQD